MIFIHYYFNNVVVVVIVIISLFIISTNNHIFSCIHYINQIISYTLYVHLLLLMMMLNPKEDHKLQSNQIRIHHIISPEILISSIMLMDVLVLATYRGWLTRPLFTYIYQQSLPPPTPSNPPAFGQMRVGSFEDNFSIWLLYIQLIHWIHKFIYCFHK